MLVEQTHELAKLALDVARDKLAKEKRDEKNRDNYRQVKAAEG